jgi:TetR/AcrR family transcriptional repressor of bet genes
MEFTISKMLPYDEVSAARHKEARKKIETVADIALGSKIFKEKFLRV